MGSEGHAWDLRDNRMHVRHTFLPHWSGGIGGEGGEGEGRGGVLAINGWRAQRCKLLHQSLIWRSKRPWW